MTNKSLKKIIKSKTEDVEVPNLVDKILSNVSYEIPLKEPSRRFNVKKVLIPFSFVIICLALVIFIPLTKNNTTTYELTDYEKQIAYQSISLSSIIEEKEDVINQMVNLVDIAANETDICFVKEDSQNPDYKTHVKVYYNDNLCSEMYYNISYNQNPSVCFDGIIVIGLNTYKMSALNNINYTENVSYSNIRINNEDNTYTLNKISDNYQFDCYQNSQKVYAIGLTYRSNKFTIQAATNAKDIEFNLTVNNGKYSGEYVMNSERGKLEIQTNDKTFGLTFDNHDISEINRFLQENTEDEDK